MKITFISDTHGQHNTLTDLNGEMIIHAGDVSSMGKIQEIKSFVTWFKNLNFEHKIFIAGNHDYYFERATESEISQLIPKEITYLNDTGVTIHGINIWGSPVQPRFYDWAFNRKRGAEIKKHWDLIPNNTDVLITHGPPVGILDKTTRGDIVGCEELIKSVKAIEPKVHVFGHIHEAYGMEEVGNTKFINASVLDENYKQVNAAVEIDFV